MREFKKPNPMATTKEKKVICSSLSENDPHPTFFLATGLACLVKGKGEEVEEGGVRGAEEGAGDGL